MGVVGGTRRPTFRPTPCLVAIMVSVFDIAESRPTKNKKQGEQVKQQGIKTGSEPIYLYIYTSDTEPNKRTNTADIFTNEQQNRQTNTEQSRPNDRPRTAESMQEQTPKHRNRDSISTNERRNIGTDAQNTEHRTDQSRTESGESPPPMRYHITIESGV
jgi:hypothetical protein